MHVPYPLSSKGRIGYTSVELDGKPIAVHLFDCPAGELDLYAKSEPPLDVHAQMRTLQHEASCLGQTLKAKVAQALSLVKDYHLADYRNEQAGKTSASEFLSTLVASDVSLWPDETWSVVFTRSEGKECYLACFRPGAPAFTMNFERDRRED
jgi:hypothetical protein